MNILIREILTESKQEFVTLESMFQYDGDELRSFAAAPYNYDEYRIKNRKGPITEIKKRQSFQPQIHTELKN